MSFKTKLGEWIDFTAEHTKGLKTLAGLAMLAYGYKTGDARAIELGWFLTGLGTNSKYQTYRATGDMSKALDIPILRKAINKIPFRNTFTPNKKDSQ
jgi:hypothetical protein